ncbi:hypothetical protein BDC45DRAFT_112805 [Circinella umbellata]|nr:hypothetical protein BDC45DRAFT_112805 [Circinella umbellata]
MPLFFSCVVVYIYIYLCFFLSLFFFTYILLLCHCFLPRQSFPINIYTLYFSHIVIVH